MGRKPAVYADYNATSPLRTSARAAMLAALEVDGNPSSIHSFGRGARRSIADARTAILTALGVPSYRLIFTSGATEALSILLRPQVGPAGKGAGGSSHLLMLATEHVAALGGHGFPNATTLPVATSGRIDEAAFEAALQGLPDDARPLVCVHGANNETGVLQPLAEIRQRTHEAGGLLVCDLVQWAGRLLIPNPAPDAFVVSAHKLGGPSGVGALVYDPQRVDLGEALIRGGGQERGARAGTENRIGIVGFGAAVSEATAMIAAEAPRVRALRDHFEAALAEQHPEARVFGAEAERLPNTSCVALPGKTASTMLMQLDLDGIAISSGAACSSGKVTASHVLSAMGVAPELAAGALRISFGWASTDEDCDRLVAAFARLA
ncbi:MAG: cysteine desulfurase [Devosiaceae bacterium]|nr:cysteine desulfurase [Devosiaceae bacterium MH13]